MFPRLAIRIGFALFFVALSAKPAFAAQWGRLATVDSATLTDTALCYWSSASGSGTLECLASNPYMVGGFLGIGTTAPQNAIDIGTSQGIRIASGTPTNTVNALYNVGGALMWNGSAVSSAVSVSTSTIGYVPYYNTASTIIGTSSIVVSNGNVGIGTNAPSDLFSVGGASTRNAYFFYDNPNIGTSIDGQSVYVYRRAASGNDYIRLYVDQYRNAKIGSLSNMMLDSSAAIYLNNTTSAPIIAYGGGNFMLKGNMGIGTTSPTSLLNVYDSAARSANTTTALVSAIGTSSTASVNKVGLDVESTGVWTGTSATNTALVVNASGGTTNYAATFMGGNVGIGTMVPNYNLQIVGSGGPTLSLGPSTTNNSGSTLHLQGITAGGTVRDSTIGVSASGGLTYATVNGTHNFVDGGAVSLLYLTNANSGAVGIGTTAPSNKLDVSGGEAIGAAYVGTHTAPANGLIVQGNVGIGTTTTPTGVTAAVNGVVQVAGTGSEPCTMAQVGAMRYNSAGRYFEMCTYP